MFDLIKLSLTGFDIVEMDRIVKHNKLQTNSKKDVIYYDNDNTKNIRDGFFIRVTPKNKKVEIECSLHKFWNWRHIRRQVNHNVFTVKNAIDTLQLLSECTGVDVYRMKVTYYEIGLNLYLDNECSQYIDKMQAIGLFDNKKELYINPRYKGSTVLTTKFYNQIKRIYKVYDKGFEMIDKGQTTHIEANILRIETIRKRVDKMTVKRLFSPSNLDGLIDAFFVDWRTLQFDGAISAPKGTHQWKIDISRSILKNGVEKTLKDVAQKGKTPKQLRVIRKFILSDWREFKKEIKVIKSLQEQEYREKLQNAVKSVIYTISVV
ncbi:MAG: hypothetical protein RRZ64_05460 [Rikenellaceae bacterium]